MIIRACVKSTGRGGAVAPRWGLLLRFQGGSLASGGQASTPARGAPNRPISERAAIGPKGELGRFVLANFSLIILKNDQHAVNLIHEEEKIQFHAWRWHPW